MVSILLFTIASKIKVSLGHGLKPSVNFMGAKLGGKKTGRDNFTT